ncbi:MAG TPA: ABC transporter permease [Gemmataceae bacterium]|nr:ABC transporter permease [Gemmataceae bacterium]
MSYALTTLWHDRQRYLPGVLAVAFSALLMVMQFGLLIGLFAITSIPIDQSHADLWVGSPEVLSVDLGRPIPEHYLCEVAAQPEVVRCERFLQGFMHWTKPNGGSELCIVVGLSLGDHALGDIHGLTRDMRLRLAEPGAIVVDEGELPRLGIRGIGSVAEITNQRVQVVGLVHGVRSLSGPYVFCSIPTARGLLRMTTDEITYVLAQCRRPEDAATVAERLRSYPTMSAFPSEAFSLHSRLHWLTKTKAGIALGLAAALGLLVGAVVTSQTLYAATAASFREYAVLRALGIPRWRMGLTVMAQSFWVGTAGLALALPIVFGLSRAARAAAVPVTIPGELVIGAAAVTMVMALVSGLAALRSLRLIEPAVLLR